MNERSANQTSLLSAFFTAIIGVSLILVVAAGNAKEVELPVNLFDGNTDNLTSDGKKALSKVIAELTPNRSTEFVIEWFGDAEGQAKTVKEYFAWEGIERTKMLVRSGHGGVRGGYYARLNINSNQIRIQVRKPKLILQVRYPGMSGTIFFPQPSE